MCRLMKDGSPVCDETNDKQTDKDIASFPKSEVPNTMPFSAD